MISIKSRITSKNEKICQNWISKAIGLMFSRKRVLVFVFKKEKIIDLHSFFVFFPINLLFLDKNKKVIEIKKNFKPFSFYTSRKKAKYLIETPFEIRCNVGDVLKLD